MSEFTFEKLQVWHKARALVKDVYQLIGKFPQTEKYGLSNQLCRAIVSVPSNLAEGCGRPSVKERIHFYEIAYGSLMESFTQITLACDLEMIELDDYNYIKPKIEEVACMISGLRKSLRERLNQSNK